MMAHHDRSIRDHVIALAEEGGLSASTAGKLYGVLKSTARACLRSCLWLSGLHKVMNRVCSSVDAGSNKD